MKLKNVLLSSFCLLFTLMLASTSYAQSHPVLFETFGYADGGTQAPCSNTSSDFYAKINTLLSDPEGQKVIHLDYHIISIADLMAQFCPNGDYVGAKLYPSTGSGQYAYYGCVDRTILPVTGTQAEPDGNSNWLSDMESAVDNEYSNNASPAATMQLDSATLDKSQANNYIFKATVAVTAMSNISDSIVIHYAIVEDGVADHSNSHCSGVQTTFDNVVRFITIGDSVVFLPGASSGSVQNVTFRQPNLTGSSGGAGATVNPANTKFIAFLTDGLYGPVISAADLKDDLDTLKGPPAMLTLTDSSLNNHTFDIGSVIPIYFTTTSLPSGVNVYYSLDNGITWRWITDAIYPPADWTVPDSTDSVTTQGKIKLVSIDEPSLVAIEDGNFTLAVKPTLGILHPSSTDTLQAGGTFNIQWTELGVNTVKLEYTLAGSGGSQFSDWVQIKDQVPGTSYTWTVPDTNSYAEVRISDDNGEAADQVSPPFPIIKHTTFGGVANSTAQTGLTITSIAPNPAENGEELIVSYADDNAARVQLEMLDLLGRVVATQTLQPSSTGEAEVPTQNVSAGAYIVRMNDGVSTVTKRVEIIR